ncbi:MAG TPA: zinc ABC transporter substrate-binding protein [Acidimicrobiales bacterium]|nr:zinc ABC transporter substrate-binding protein [Acidimicrobiales bacterium]
MILRNLLSGLVAMGVAVATVSVAGAAPVKKPLIVAGVSEWGALARQLVGEDAHVVTLLTDPNADPHEHEATVHDAGYVALASVVLENGAGYDTWLSKLVAVSQPDVARVNVASLAGVSTGSNPHLFYSPRVAARFVEALTSTLARLRPAIDVRGRARALERELARVDVRLASIKARCGGVKVAATEDVATRLLTQAGLDVVTPKSLRLAVSNGIDPSVRPLAQALGQLSQRPAFLLNNIQTSTPLTDTMVARARALGVPLVKVTESMRGSNYVGFLNGVLDQMQTALARQGCAA